MKANFWVVEKSITQIFEKSVKPHKSNATLWDIFSNYTPQLLNDKTTVPKNSKWLDQHRHVVHTICDTYFADHHLNGREIELLMEAIEEYLLPEDQQETEHLYAKLKDVARAVVKTQLESLQLTGKNLWDLLIALEVELQKRNSQHIAASAKETQTQWIKLEGIKGTYTEEQVSTILKNLEQSWTHIPVNSEEYTENERNEDKENSTIDAFEYLQLELAYSTTFFDDKDAGYLSFEEQEEIANKKFEDYKNEVSELLGQNPDEQLLPKLDYNKLNNDIKKEEMYWLYLEKNPFMFQFEGDFTVWKATDKVLFLSTHKEDKELAYEIHLGELPLNHYMELVNKYNSITG